MSKDSKKAFIYFLVDADASKARFKIGLSVDPYRRSKTLEQSFDLENSWQFECDADDVHQIEQETHEYCSRYRISPDEMGEVAGKTEWFRIECLSGLLEQVRHERNTHLFRNPTNVVRRNRAVQIFLPEDLYWKIRWVKLQNDSTVQQEIQAVLEQHFKDVKIEAPPFAAAPAPARE